MSQPRLAPGVRLSFDQRRQSWILQAPERVVLLDAIGADVLKHVDGKTATAAIVASLAEEYDASADEIAGDIADLIADLAERGLLVVR
ncbi:pyrroloquinoline quinone biosynthesis peptide chaperone PqqD [Zavarzinia compransoris]|uniref:pyrroloquinoline quinone biosynthesis peptide chaperone PqqD n=1 Tax=Zavarzinia compransoris TaxID=1264899 RepID=UPI0010EA0456|nr:pyrroloquinoline quinone biosynthesis peptide chaperone PqqD [Zavarzinia compransoris]TDP45938.1 pyrroloquinoline quinone biosynthesis protein D [Zavarzinia compransoris]